MLDQFIQDAASDANVPDRVTALRAITGAAGEGEGSDDP